MFDSHSPSYAGEELRLGEDVSNDAARLVRLTADLSSKSVQIQEAST